MFRRLGQLCHDHRRIVVIAWAVIFVVGIGLAASGTVTSRFTQDQGSHNLESVRGFDVLNDASPYGPRLSAVVDGVDVSDPALRSALRRVQADLMTVHGVARVMTPADAPVPALLATDHCAVLVTVDLAKDLPSGAQDSALAAVEDRLRALTTAVPGASVVLGGNTLLRKEVNHQTSQDTALGEGIALPVTLLVMIVLFAGFLAASVPFLGALVSIGGGMLALYGFSFVVDLDPNVLSVTSVLGLGLSIDYALLMVSRFREERAAGLESRDAVVRTVETAGRTIAFSALTVATSLAGLFVFPSTIFRALGAAGVGIVLIALTVALTLTPALLTFFATRISARGRPAGDDGFFARVGRAMQRRPVVVTVAVAAVLIGAGLPFLGANFTNSGSKLLPRAFESRHFADLVAARFPGRAVDPVTVVARTDAASLDRWATALPGSRDVASVSRAQQLAPGVSTVDIVPVGSNHDAAAQDLVTRLRGMRPVSEAWVTGPAAVLVDFKAEVAEGAPWALGLIALATFVLLFAMTGSVLVPVKALVMNVLSLGASFGALVFVFQDGHGSSLFGFDSAGGLETVVPVLVFAFAFGLSMDYEVFLLARVKEIYDSGATNDRAVQLGLQRSGRIITSAALLIVLVFAGFATGKMLVIKELGLAMAIAITVDATLVRCLLVPATMTLLGDLNWWAPAPLRRWHRRMRLTPR